MFLNKKVFLAAALVAAIVGSMQIAPAAHAIDITLDGVGSLSAGSGADKLDKAIGILNVIEQKWFLLFDVLGVILLSIGALVLRMKNPDAWARYLHYIVALLLFLAAPAIYKVLKALAQAAL